MGHAYCMPLTTGKSEAKHFLALLTACMSVGHSVRRSSSLDWKKDRNRTEPNRKRPDHQLQLHKFWIFSVASCDVCQKIEKPKKNRSRPIATSLSSCHVLYLTHAHFSLIVGPWIKKKRSRIGWDIAKNIFIRNLNVCPFCFRHISAKS